MFAQVNRAIFTLIKPSEAADMKSNFSFRKRVFLLPASTDCTLYIHAIVQSSHNGEYRWEANVLYIADCGRKIEIDFVVGNKRQGRLAPRKINLIMSMLLSLREALAQEIALIENTSGIIKTIMVALEETISIPLVVTEQGTIRIKGSRVSLDSIVHHFKLGATAEQIVQSFPSLSLGDVYSSIAYYLTHRQEIETYLEQQKVAADKLQEQLESNPDYQAEVGELRSRILRRWAVAEENGEATPTS
jgi:uncharacterized protein (DUF433 family)